MSSPTNEESAPLFVVAATPDGETGSARATPLQSSSKWSVGLQSGAFSWLLPLPKVPAVVGAAPTFDLAYSSQAVDGLVASENNQASWVGLGWDLALPHVERRYNACNSDTSGNTVRTQDLCWNGEQEQYWLALVGVSSPLVRDRDTEGDAWRVRDDPGWVVQRLRGANNGDNDGEYWVVTTPQGTRFTFGQGHQDATEKPTESVFTVPVFGDDPGEPCHQVDFQESWCDQAWRWNLDKVQDSHGNLSSYFYTKERNRYARNGISARSTDYVRSGVLRDVTYSQQAGHEDEQAPARLHFTVAPRCLEYTQGGSCPTLEADHQSSFPDVPVDGVCSDACLGPAQSAPTFFTQYLLSRVTAQRSDGSGGWVDVDRLDLDYSFWDPSDGTTPSLWLEKAQQTGLAGGQDLSLPAVVFSGQELANRFDADAALGAPEMRKSRISAVVDELGRRVEVDYGQPNPCTPGNRPPPYDTNRRDCFPGWRINGTDEGFGVWNKWLTTQVTVRDTTGGAPPQVTSYRYHGKPAWHYDATPLSPAAHISWSDWRGYGSVDVATLSDPAYRGEASTRALTLTRSRFFRGMDGDRLSDGDTKHVVVTDSQGTSLPDLAYLRDQVREVQLFGVESTGAATQELFGTLTDYTSVRTTPSTPDEEDPQQDAHLVVVSTTKDRETVLPDGPGGTTSVRTTEQRMSYDSYGQLTANEDTATPGDTRCTKRAYPRDAATVAAWMLAYPYRTRAYAGPCDQPTRLIAGADVYYDGQARLGAPVTRGDPTRTETAKTADDEDPLNPSDTASTRATYDTYGRAVTQTNGNGNTLRTVYEPAAGRPTTITQIDPLGHVMTTTLEPDRQQPVAVLDPNGQVTRSRYDALGRLLAVRQPGQANTDPPALVFGYRLDAAHQQPPRITTKTLLRGHTYTTTWAFMDSLGRPRQQQEVSPATRDGRTQQTLVRGELRYDDTGRLATDTMPFVAAGAPGTTLVAVAPDEIDEVRHSYDALGREIKTTQLGLGRPLWSSTTTYFGDHQRITPPRGGVLTTTWTDTRGRRVRQDEGVGAEKATTRYAYTAADLVAGITDPTGHDTRLTYDLLGNRIATNDPDAGPSLAAYDDNGNQTAIWDGETLHNSGPTGRPTVSTVYDALDRPVSRWSGWPQTGRKLAAFTYDSRDVANGIGQLARQHTFVRGQRFTVEATGYDARFRLTGKKWTFPARLVPPGTRRTYLVRYAYDNADHLTTIGYRQRLPGGPRETITTGYDPLGNPTTLSGAVVTRSGASHTRHYVTNTGYAPDGKLASRDYANPRHPLRQEYSYAGDTQRLLQARTLVRRGTRPGDPLRTRDANHFTWDPAGNLLVRSDNRRHVITCHAYDTLNRLVYARTTHRQHCPQPVAARSARSQNPQYIKKAYAYRADGNLIRKHLFLLKRNVHYLYQDTHHPHAVTASRQVNGAQVNGAHDTRYDYDRNGALIQTRGHRLVTTYEWDPQHQLTVVVRQRPTSTKTRVTQFAYAPDGTRLARTTPSGRTTLYIDGEEIRVAPGHHARATRFYTLTGTLVAQRSRNRLTWQLPAVHGSPRLHIKAGTPTVRHSHYNPFGVQHKGSAAENSDRGWLGAIRDPSTRLIALGARYYDPALGRFISPDPIIDTTTTQTLHPYSYARNNPISFADPNGLWGIPNPISAVTSAATAVGSFVENNAGTLTDVAVGVGIGLAVGAACAGTAGVGCVLAGAALAGAAGATAGYGVDVATGEEDFSFGGLTKRVVVETGISVATAGLAHGAGQVASRMASRTAAAEAETVGGKIATAGNAASREASSTAAGPKATVTGSRTTTSGASTTASAPSASAGQQLAASDAEDAVSITTRYSRPSAATTRAQREAVQGQPCVECGDIAQRQVADHIDPLVKEYYRTGTIDLQRMRALEAVQPQCPTCSARQGALLSRYSTEMRRLLGLE